MDSDVSSDKLFSLSELKSSGVSSSISKFSKPLETSGSSTLWVSSIICSSDAKLFVKTSLLFCSSCSASLTVSSWISFSNFNAVAPSDIGAATLDEKLNDWWESEFWNSE